MGTTYSEMPKDFKIQAIAGPKEIIFTMSPKIFKQDVWEAFGTVYSGKKICSRFRLTETCRSASVKDLQPGCSYTYTWNVSHKYNTYLYQNDEITTLPLSGFDYVLKSDSKSEEMYDALLKELKEYKPPLGLSNINLLVLGKIGSGKSSFINTILSALKGKYIQAANPGKSFSSTTQLISYHELSPVGVPNINLVDIFGLEPGSLAIHRKIIDPLLHGEIPEDYSLADAENLVRENKAFEPTSESAQNKMNRIISGIIFVIEQDSADAPNVLQELFTFYSEIQSKGIPFVAVCTRVDKMFPHSSFDMRDLYTAPQICTALDILTRNLPAFDINQTFPFANYTGPYYKRDFQRDYMGLVVLSHLVDAANLYLLRKGSNKYK